MENYRDVITSLRVCAGEDEKEGCEGCIYETDVCYNATKLLSRAACVIEDLCALLEAEQKEGEENGPMHKMQMETDLHTVRPEPMQAEEGLGTSSEEDTPLDKLAKDLRAGWGWLSDDMPIPADIRPNMLKASKVLGIISGYLKMDEFIRVSALAAIGDAMK